MVERAPGWLTGPHPMLGLTRDSQPWSLGRQGPLSINLSRFPETLEKAHYSYTLGFLGQAFHVCLCLVGDKSKGVTSGSQKGQCQGQSWSPVTARVPRRGHPERAGWEDVIPAWIRHQGGRALSWTGGDVQTLW